MLKKIKFEIKSVLFGYFWSGIYKNYCHISNHNSLCKRKNFEFGTKK